MLQQFSTDVFKLVQLDTDTDQQYPEEYDTRCLYGWLERSEIAAKP